MANSRICSIPDCGKKHFGRGWCGMHYMRWRDHGDPLRERDGKAKNFYRDVVLPYDGDECLIWPFGRDRNGYAVLKHRRSTILSRRLCEEVQGPPPTPDHDAAHSCGKGRQGCVAKRHLSWKTRVENEADKRLHGTLVFGEHHHQAKLTEADVHTIRALKGKVSQTKLAEMYGVSQTGISFIHLGKSWRRLQSR